jgi:hypothetical protein
MVNREAGENHERVPGSVQDGIGRELRELRGMVG